VGCGLKIPEKQQSPKNGALEPCKLQNIAEQQVFDTDAATGSLD
jgi:hypothetical protein